MPSRTAAIRYGLGGLALIVATTFVEIGLHGFNIEKWGAVSSITLLLVSTWSGLLLLHRYRSHRHIEWLLLGIGVLGWAVGQLLYSLQITLTDSTAWPSFPDVGYLLWPIGAIGALLIHTRPFERSSRARVHRRLDGAGRLVELHRLGDHHPLRRRRPGAVPARRADRHVGLSAHRHRHHLDARTAVVDQQVAGPDLPVRRGTVGDRGRHRLFVDGRLDIELVVRGVVPHLGAGVRRVGHCCGHAELRSRSLHPTDVATAASRTSAGDGRASGWRHGAT